ncbi:hypothetical protein DC3_49020 [Deinococcus cellulosilyticus NBRC 106333 = KACC 11606]|uniref:Transcriptional regulator n=1 Tax=Deinococcus cellulosilyticus (strain DSM 18568 / NBRC 106333 / KACC 11606 / 5516J-15) TaxID=1223518 RepID=A0A511N9N5_DEIC1|nr:hypothetical protein DC3_49020 [Deinococcus cellulosilyticus NBRC 106333 = KACC 11606]
MLSDAGLIEVEAVANKRVCTLRAAPFQELDQWLSTYRKLWEERYDRLDDYLQKLQQERKEKTESQTPTEDQNSNPDRRKP